LRSVWETKFEKKYKGYDIKITTDVTPNKPKILSDSSFDDTKKEFNELMSALEEKFSEYNIEECIDCVKPDYPLDIDTNTLDWYRYIQLLREQVP